MRSFEDLIARAQTLGRRRLAIVFSTDPELLLAVEKAVQAGIARPLFLGREPQVAAMKAELGLAFDEEHLDAPEEGTALDLAARLIADGDADIAAVASDEAAASLSEKIKLLAGHADPSSLSRLLLFKPESWERLFLLGSPPPGLRPEPEHLKLVIRRAVALAHRLGWQVPTAALIESAQPRRSDRWREWGIDRLRGVARQDGDWTMEGPLTLGEALSADAHYRTERVRPNLESADILVAPDAEVASAIGETLSWFARCRFATLAVGASAPILLAAQSDSYDTRFNSIALASVATRE